MTTFNLHKESRSIASEAWYAALFEFGKDCDPYELGESAREFIHESCDGSQVAIYYVQAIDFCATNDTSDGEQWLEDCGGIAQDGDTFGQIASRIAFATLLCASEAALSDIIAEYVETLEGES